MAICMLLRSTAKLRATASKSHATARTNPAELDLCAKARTCMPSVAATNVCAVIEIGVLDYNACGRRLACTVSTDNVVRICTYM